MHQCLKKISNNRTKSSLFTEAILAGILRFKDVFAASSNDLVTAFACREKSGRVVAVAIDF